MSSLYRPFPKYAKQENPGYLLLFLTCLHSLCTDALICLRDHDFSADSYPVSVQWLRPSSRSLCAAPSTTGHWLLAGFFSEYSNTDNQNNHKLVLHSS